MVGVALFHLVRFVVEVGTRVNGCEFGSEVGGVLTQVGRCGRVKEDAAARLRLLDVNQLAECFRVSRAEVVESDADATRAEGCTVHNLDSVIREWFQAARAEGAANECQG